MTYLNTEACSFVVQLHPSAAHEHWGFALDEVTPIGVERVATVTPKRAAQHRPAVVAAIKSDGYRTTRLGLSHRRKPLTLTQDPGVRLALSVLATDPLRSVARRNAVADGIQRLGVEESLYWFAQVRGCNGRRALRALHCLWPRSEKWRAKQAGHVCSLRMSFLSKRSGLSVYARAPLFRDNSPNSRPCMSGGHAAFSGKFSRDSRQSHAHLEPITGRSVPQQSRACDATELPKVVPQALRNFG